MGSPWGGDPLEWVGKISEKARGWPRYGAQRVEGGRWIGGLMWREVGTRVGLGGERRGVQRREV